MDNMRCKYNQLLIFASIIDKNIRKKMALQILLAAAGLFLIVFGADFLVDGASAVARKLGISEFVIGLTIVGFGTSCPELVVSITGALAGNSDISIGNVVGSNIFNSLLILGVTALIMPVSITATNKKIDIPITVGVTMLLILLGMKGTIFGVGNNELSRLEGIMFLLFFSGYIYFCFKKGAGSDEDVPQKKMGTAKAVIYIILGLGGLIYGGELFVDSATTIAKMANVSDKVIAITLLAGGTSLPELATCIVAAAKKKGQLALGNILGSNVFNILLILGCSATITPLSFANINLVDMGILLVSILLIWTSVITGKRDTLDRFDGILLLAAEICYLAFLFITM